MRINLIRILIFIVFYITFDLLFSNFILKKNYFSCYNDTNSNFYSLYSNCSSYERYAGEDFKVITDENGFRTSGKKKDFKKENIVFLGDSQVYGVGLDYKNTFVGQIENYLSKYNIYNLGVSSYSPLVYKYQLKSFIKKNFKINKIILVLDIGDLHEDTYRWKEIKINSNEHIPILNEKKADKKVIKKLKKFKSENFKGTKIISYHVRSFLRKIKNKKNKENINFQKQIKKTFIGEFTYTKKDNLGKEWHGAKFDVLLQTIKSNLKEISNLSKSINSEFYIVILPWPETLAYGQKEFNWEKYNENLCTEIRCTKLINLFPMFNKLKKNNENWKNMFFLKYDFHPNQLGSLLISEEILKVLNI